MAVSLIGAAIDIGTSHVTIQLVDLNSGNLLKKWRFPNPQQAAGFDVISRIRHSLQDSSNAKKMTIMIREAVRSEAEKSLKALGLRNSSLDSIVIVGNTVMHHFFFDLPVRSLIKPPYKAEHKSAILTSGADIGFPCFEKAEVYSPPVVESYVGPDALMLLLTSGMHQDATSAVAADVGTNTEIIVNHNDVLWIASAASGPAFEGMSMECGMSSEEGAISKVRIDSSGRPIISVIGDVRPKGICGSGAISAMAGLLDLGLMNTRGSLVAKEKSPWFLEFQGGLKLILSQATTTETGKPLFLSQIDLRQLQLSKAAICAVTRLLLERAKCEYNEVLRLFLTGAFGSELNPRDAFRIGLFPRLPHAEIEQMSSGAVRGATRVLLEQHLRVDIEDAARRLRYLELTDDSDFHRLNLESQFFPDT